MSDRDELLDRWSAYARNETDAPSPDDRRALHAWCDAGDAHALFVLGLVLDRERAATTRSQDAWLEAARYGHAAAMYQLALVYWSVLDDEGDIADEPGTPRLDEVLDGAAPDDVDVAVDPTTVTPVRQRARMVYWFRRAALGGHVDAAAKFGNILFGAGERYRGAAAQWYERAADAGNAGAATMLADMLYHGNGVAIDRTAADMYYRRVVAHYESITRDPGADVEYELVMLGEMYRAGLGTPRDIARAITCWERAAARGYDYAMTKLANLYSDGEDVAYDFALADHWLQRALEASDGTDDYAQFCIDDLPRKRIEAARQLFDRVPTEQLRRLVDAGDPNVFLPDRADSPFAPIHGVAAGTSFNLMSVVITRLEDEGETGSALALMEQWALAGHRATAFHLARRYELGWAGAPRDFGATMRWLRHAAHLGEPMAMLRLAERLMIDDYGTPDPAQALAWLRLAAQPRFESPIPGLRDAAHAHAEVLAGSLTPEQRAAADAMTSSEGHDSATRWPGAVA